VDEDVEEPRKRGKLIPILWISMWIRKNLKIVARRGCAPAPGGTRNLPRRQYQGPRPGGNSQADRHRATGVREGLLNLRPAPRNRAPERSENAGDVKLRGTLHLIRGGCPFLVSHPRTDQVPSRCDTPQVSRQLIARFGAGDVSGPPQDGKASPSNSVGYIQNYPLPIGGSQRPHSECTLFLYTHGHRGLALE
jgi:hypothetical protein